MKKRILAMLLTVCMVFSMLPMSALAARIVDDVPLAALPTGDEVHDHDHDHDHAHEAALPSNATDAAQLAEVTAGETEEPTEPGEGQQWAYLGFGNNGGTGWGLIASANYNVALYQMDENSGTLARTVTDGATYQIMGLDSPNNDKFPWLHVYSDGDRTNQCRWSNRTKPETITSTDDNHKFVFASAGNGFFTIKRVGTGTADYLGNVAYNKYLPQFSLGYYSQILTTDEAHAAKFKVEPVEGQTGVYTLKTIIDVYDDGADLPTAIAANYSAGDLAMEGVVAASETTAEGGANGVVGAGAAVDGNTSSYWHSKWELATTNEKSATQVKNRYIYVTDRKSVV